MTLNDIFRMVDALSPQDRRRLREYIDDHAASESDTRTGLDVEGLLGDLDEIRNGMTPEEFELIEKAMNEG